ncbi:MAG: hypothetical protein Athens041674_103 [Parcubacteria group bacterium Athens0416_74]|nr:MAG: hypothetical protein Athens041674_103 [Parcubacteria group bacterium Athens0416_74]
MITSRLVDGPTAAQVSIALASLILSANREPERLTFLVDEGPEGQPNPVEREFAICGFHSYGGGDSPIALLLPITGPGAPEKPTKIIFYPTAPRGHIGHLEVTEEDEQ